MKETVTCWIQRETHKRLKVFSLPTKLLKDFPPWQTVYDQFSKWNKRGVWEAALAAVNRLHRKKAKPHV